MADTADLRSEGKCSDNPQAIQSRQQRLDYIKSGVCISCAITAVKNRTVCYACSAKQAKSQQMYGFRKVLRDNGIDDFEAAAAVVQRVAVYAMLDDDDTINSLIKALRSATKPQRTKRKRIRIREYVYKPSGKNPYGPRKKNPE